MQQQATTDAYQEDPEFSFGQQLHEWLQKSRRIVLCYWRLLLIIAILGAVSGSLYAIFKPITYTASMSFVMEDAKTSGGSLMSALSGSLGLDLGGLAGGSGMLAGDNIQALVKSPTIIRNTLLTTYADTGVYSLADKYAEVTHLREKWRDNRKVKQLVFFPCGQPFSRLQDSLIQCIIQKVTKNALSLAKPDKKLSIFELQIVSKDERWSQLFCERILKATTDFYINTKTSRLKSNIEHLQQRADSVAALLNRKTFTSTKSNVLLLDANPAYADPEASAEISSRDKILLTTIYAEIVKNLEINKTALVQETPTMQIIDYPLLPLKQNKLSWVLTAIECACLFLVVAFSILWLLQKKTSQQNIKQVVM